MIMGTPRSVNALDFRELPEIYINDSVIPYEDTVKYLGIHLSSNLSWDTHVINVIKTTAKVYACLHQLKLCRQLLPIPTRIRLIGSLVIPLYDYCSSALTDISGKQNLRLQKSLNSCVRFIYQAKRDEHITPYFERLHWLKIKTRHLYFVGCLTFLLLNGSIPGAAFCDFERRMDVTRREARASGDALVLPLCRTEFYKRSFKCSAVEFWNGLPSHIKNAPFLDTFKRGLYGHLPCNH
ncbi:PREDICTED: uncharacterized protein LOC105449815 [Wasmannia auropunctata]|uniref:uncharacterized protein LOC105449815 n=1 Tax=Wasmannia auropunctata TaxID=64793 RepID=UPI0005EF5969|nr:PREDICTED: uncharacterized protein LOC105449815 [Wasmannia auropunctata]